MGALKVAQWNEGRAAFPLLPEDNGENNDVSVEREQ